MKLLYVPLFFLLAFILPACVNEECDEDALPRPVLNIAFKKYTNTNRTPQNTKDTLLNVTTAYAERLENTPFYTPATADARIKSVALHLSPSTDATTFFLLSKNATNQVITQRFTVTYTKQPKFISQACGYEIRYSNLAVQKPATDFDDVLVVVPEINPIRNEIHIQLFIKP